MIAYMHTAEWASMVVLENMPRAEELIRVTPLTDGCDGIYEVLRVMHTLDSEQIDFYARRIGDGLTRVGWNDVMGLLNQQRESNRE